MKKFINGLNNICEGNIDEDVGAVLRSHFMNFLNLMSP